MLIIINELPNKVNFIAGTTKEAKLLILLCYLLFSLIFLSIVYIKKAFLFDEWYWQIMLCVGIVFLLLPLKKENRQATIYIAIDNQFIYMMLPYSYKGKYLKIDKKIVNKVFKSMAFDKYRALSLRIDESFITNEIYHELSFMMKKEGTMINVTSQVGMTSYKTIEEKLDLYGVFIAKKNNINEKY